MNEEVEIKVILKNPKETEERLRNSAKFVKERRQEDEYFVPRHKDFFKANPVTEYLRVRHEEGKNNMGYHLCHFDNEGELLKTDEYELKIEDPRMASDILKKLDMAHKVTVKKTRRHFDYKDFEISLDYVEGLGYFLEVEAKKIFGSIEITREKCHGVLKELGVVWEKPKGLGYPLLLLKKIGGN